MLDFYSSSLISLESLFICLSIDALFVRIVSTGARAGVSKLGVKSKRKSCKIDQMVYGKCMLCHVLGCMHVPTAHSLSRNLRRTEWAVGTTRAFSHKRKAQDFTVACISHTIRSILQLLFLDVAPNLLTLHAPVKQS